MWGIDITYIRLCGGWLYLVAVIDWFSHYVVSWELDQTLEMPFVVTTVERALAQATPVIWNSDQDSHFTSPQYTQLLLNAGVQTPALAAQVQVSVWTAKGVPAIHLQRAALA